MPDLIVSQPDAAPWERKHAVRFAVDLELLTWMGWDFFAVLDSALRTGARQLGWTTYGDQELKIADERPFGWVATFQVWPPSDT